MPKPGSDRSIFSNVSSLMPGRSVFDLSHEVKLTCDMGQLIPILCEEVVPGDRFDIGAEVVLRFQPMVAPMMHEVNVYLHYFFAPYRLLWTLWEQFITGGEDGQDASVLPRWSVTDNAVGSLWDFLGFPAGVTPDATSLPLDFPKRAYNFIYNKMYRAEALIQEVDITTSETVKIRAWEKDYFTVALPWQQRGTAPSLPISGQLPLYTASQFGVANRYLENRATGSTLNVNMHDNTVGVNPDQYFANAAAATTFNVADLRLAFQIQKWLERNARAGARYTEFLQAHFGVSPRDERLQRPEYIGGLKSPVVVSEVLKTSTDGTSPQGTMAGHGLSVNRNYVGKYHVQEYGIIMGILSVMPRTMYQQGIDRSWLRRSKYDFYSPEFANLSEQAVERVELYATAVQSENRTIFGYQGRFDELRVRRNRVSGLMRTTFNYWHLGRIFGSAPLLNQSFVECVPDKRIFAVTNQPELIVTVGNKVRAVRPLPLASDPGLIDHN